jgi:hypothetical protein
MHLSIDPYFDYLTNSSDSESIDHRYLMEQLFNAVLQPRASLLPVSTRPSRHHHFGHRSSKRHRLNASMDEERPVTLGRCAQLVTMNAFSNTTEISGSVGVQANPLPLQSSIRDSEIPLAAACNTRKPKRARCKKRAAGGRARRRTKNRPWSFRDDVLLVRGRELKLSPRYIAYHLGRTLLEGDRRYAKVYPPPPPDPLRAPENRFIARLRREPAFPAEEHDCSFDHDRASKPQP